MSSNIGSIRFLPITTTHTTYHGYTFDSIITALTRAINHGDKATARLLLQETVLFLQAEGEENQEKAGKALTYLADRLWPNHVLQHFNAYLEPGTAMAVKYFVEQFKAETSELQDSSVLLALAVDALCDSQNRGHTVPSGVARFHTALLPRWIEKTMVEPPAAVSITCDLPFKPTSKTSELAYNRFKQLYQAVVDKDDGRIIHWTHQLISMQFFLKESVDEFEHVLDKNVEGTEIKATYKLKRSEALVWKYLFGVVEDENVRVNKLLKRFVQAMWDISAESRLQKRGSNYTNSDLALIHAVLAVAHYDDVDYTQQNSQLKEMFRRNTVDDTWSSEVNELAGQTELKLPEYTGFVGDVKNIRKASVHHQDPIENDIVYEHVTKSTQEIKEWDDTYTKCESLRIKYKPIPASSKAGKRLSNNWVRDTVKDKANNTANQEVPDLIEADSSSGKGKKRKSKTSQPQRSDDSDTEVQLTAESNSSEDEVSSVTRPEELCLPSVIGSKKNPLPVEEAAFLRPPSTQVTQPIYVVKVTQNGKKRIYEARKITDANRSGVARMEALNLLKPYLNLPTLEMHREGSKWLLVQNYFGLSRKQKIPKYNPQLSGEYKPFRVGVLDWSGCNGAGRLASSLKPEEWTKRLMKQLFCTIVVLRVFNCNQVALKNMIVRDEINSDNETEQWLCSLDETGQKPNRSKPKPVVGSSTNSSRAQHADAAFTQHPFIKSLFSIAPSPALCKQFVEYWERPKQQIEIHKYLETVQVEVTNFKKSMESDGTEDVLKYDKAVVRIQRMIQSFPGPAYDEDGREPAKKKQKIDSSDDDDEGSATEQVNETRNGHSKKTTEEEMGSDSNSD